MTSPDPALNVAHIVMCALAAMRLTDVLIFDRISGALRARLRWYIFTCPRCLSVWTGAVALVVYVVFPWLNWPFALSWLYLRAARR